MPAASHDRPASVRSLFRLRGSVTGVGNPRTACTGDQQPNALASAPDAADVIHHEDETGIGDPEDPDTVDVFDVRSRRRGLQGREVAGLEETGHPQPLVETLGRFRRGVGRGGRHCVGGLGARLAEGQPHPAAAGGGVGDFFVISREPGPPEGRMRARKRFPERRRDVVSGGRKRHGTVDLQFDYSFRF